MLRNKLYVSGDDNLFVPAHLNYGQYMLHKFLGFGDRVAIIDPVTGDTLTYTALAQLTVDIALSLSEAGVRKGDVVSICSEERLEYMPTALAIMCTGAVFSSTDVHGEATIKHRTQLTKPKLIFCSGPAYAAHGPLLRESGAACVVYAASAAGATTFKDFLKATASPADFVPVPVKGWEDPAMMLFSSGTTGLPKPVPLSHMNVMMDMFALIDSDFYTGKVVLTATEFYTFGLSCLHAGATVVFSLTDEAEDVIKAVDKHKIQIVQEMPSTLFDLANFPEGKYDASSMEHILSASAPLRPELVDAMKKRYPSLKRVCQAYGATEAGVMCSDERAPVTKPGSVGKACPGVVIKVVDVESREPVGVNERGEICFKSPSVFPGYSGVSTLNHMDEEGFYLTGDVGYYDEDEYFFIVDRIKDMIKYHGFAIAPMELEAVLLSHESVSLAAVVGAPDAQYHELAVGFVVLKEGSEVGADELTAFVNDKVAHWMPLAGGVRFVQSMPRNRRGKVDKKILKSML